MFLFESVTVFVFVVLMVVVGGDGIVIVAVVDFVADVVGGFLRVLSPEGFLLVTFDFQRLILT